MYLHSIRVCLSVDSQEWTSFKTISSCLLDIQTYQKIYEWVTTKTLLETFYYSPLSLSEAIKRSNVFVPRIDFSTAANDHDKELLIAQVFAFFKNAL